MSGSIRRDTKPELRVRRNLHAMGLRFRVDFAPEAAVRSRADIVFTRVRVAIFIDGCFWHACPDHYRPPSANQAYWHPKIERNRQRDIRKTAALTEAGWLVLRYWEHEPVESVVRSIERAYAERLNDVAGSYQSRGSVKQLSGNM